MLSLLPTVVNRQLTVTGASFVLLALFTLTTVCGRHSYVHRADDGIASERLNKVSSVRASKSQDGKLTPRPVS